MVRRRGWLLETPKKVPEAMLIAAPTIILKTPLYICGGYFLYWAIWMCGTLIPFITFINDVNGGFKCEDMID